MRPFLLLLVLLFLSLGPSPNAQEVVRLEPGRRIQRELAGRQAHGYQIPLEEGQYASVVVEHRGIDIVVRWLAADGKLSGEFDSELRPDGEEHVELVGETTGPYTLSVEARRQNAPAGTYVIRIAALRPATAEDRSLHEARGLLAESGRLWRTGKYDAALVPALRAITVREHALGPEHADVAAALNNLGIIHYFKGDLEEAESVYRRALKIRETALGSDHPAVASTVNNIAEMRRLRGDYAAADSLYREAIASWERSLGQDHPALGLPLTNLAIVRRLVGDYSESELLYQRALAIREKALGTEHPEVATSLNNLGNLYMSRRDFDKAEVSLQRALEIWTRTLGLEHPYVAAALHNLGRIQRARGDLVKAEALYRRSLEIKKGSPGPAHPDFASTLDDLGRVAHARGDLEAAEALHRRALEIYETALGAEHPELAFSLEDLANIHSARGDFHEAERLYQRALKIRERALGPDHPDVATVFSGMAVLYATAGDSARALATQARANAILEQHIGVNLLIGSERQKLAYLSRLWEMTDRTLTLHSQTMPDDGEVRRIAVAAVLQRKGRVQDAMTDSLAALRRRLNSQDQRLLDQLRETTGRLATLVLDGPQRTSVAGYREQIAALERRREDVEDEISRRSAGTYQRAAPATLAATQAAIPPNAALVEFAIYTPFDPKTSGRAIADGFPRYVAYVMRGEGEPSWAELGDAAPIDTAIEELRRALRDPKRQDVGRLARAVDQKVMQKIRALAGDATHLLISPDGSLNLIPFEALVDARGRYLVQRYAFTYLTSGRDLLRRDVARDSGSRPTLIADPAFGEPATRATGDLRRRKLPAAKRGSVTTGRSLSEVYFAPLVGTGEEARTIRMMYPEATLLTGSRATESALKSVMAPHILHIATHGFFLQDLQPATGGKASPTTQEIDPDFRVENPLLRSGLALAGANRRGGEGDDGILTALEASGLNLWGTKLVVLSACDTGVGEVRIGEGVYGLRRAFVLAGAESLVMSLWPVSDSSTRRLMASYYRNLKRGDGRGAALRAVQLEMLRRNKALHPFYWANFIQSGDWRELAASR